MNNKFDNSDIECIALGLSQNVSIETTILEACGVTDIGWGERVLYTLSLEENVITDIGVSALLLIIFNTASLYHLGFQSYNTNLFEECLLLAK
eukprot:CCRYP_017433-RA/>CCRYP_017433-RA protein AED:0.32 eAED:0.48 QI:0/0/0/1/0/0/2/0/92